MPTVYRTMDDLETALMVDPAYVWRVVVYHGIERVGGQFEGVCYRACLHFQHDANRSSYAYVTLNGRDDDRRLFGIAGDVDIEFVS